jgi:Ca2+-binding RTX toxin-like protein
VRNYAGNDALKAQDFAPPECASIRSTLQRIVYIGGSPGTPSNQSELILGTAGNDTINAGGGDDCVLGGGGNDTINGGAGNDVILGGPDNDNLRGWTGDDIVIGGPGTDTVRGDGGYDVCYGEIYPAGHGCEVINNPG